MKWIPNLLEKSPEKIYPGWTRNSRKKERNKLPLVIICATRVLYSSKCPGRSYPGTTGKLFIHVIKCDTIKIFKRHISKLRKSAYKIRKEGKLMVLHELFQQVNKMGEEQKR